MSLGIAFKGPEGIVLAADSRVTLTTEKLSPGGNFMFSSTFDNATKLLKISHHDYVGVITYGLGAIGQNEPRTAHSLLPEFEEKLPKERLQIEKFAEKLCVFFEEQWKDKMPEEYSGQDLVFLIGGFDEGEPYGKVYQVNIPSKPKPVEQNKGSFGISWGGQLEFVNRLLKGFDPRLPSMAQSILNLSDDQKTQLERGLGPMLSSRIPYQFLPLQDCVDLSIFLIRTTMEIQAWMVAVRGVGGAIDVATITRTDGFTPVQQKSIKGQEVYQEV